MDGLMLIDKPRGRTSSDVVVEVRRRLTAELGVRPRVGHAGTLDPFATGLLVVLVGRATRIQRFVMGLPKLYDVQVRFGWTSTTGDPEGELHESGRRPGWAGRVDDRGPQAYLPTGRLRQRPPAISAVKVAGRRAYALARAGEEVELPEREVLVERFERTGPDAFRVGCSAGTYIRSLVMEFEDAYCLELRRVAIGPFAVEDADPERLVPLPEVLDRLFDRADVPAAVARDTAHGKAVTCAAAGLEDLEPGRLVVLWDDDGPVALVERADGGAALRVVVGFRAS